MKSMKSMAKVLLLSVALGGAVLGLGRTADASHGKLKVVAPIRLTAGDSAEVQAILRSADDGLPIAAAAVTFYMEASFGGIDGEVELGRAMTDENGAAIISYQPRSEGEHQIRVEYLTPGASEPEEVTWSHSVAGATGQLYRSTAGVQIPGLNVWLLVALVSGVWAILLSVALRVVAIARAGTAAEVMASEADRPAGVEAPAAASRSGSTAAR